jgi:hypothetical protein
LFLAVILFAACGEKKETPEKDHGNPAVLLSEVKDFLGEEVKIVYTGVFDDDKIEKIAVGSEINTKEVWGIKFFLLVKDDDKPEIIFETDILDGSFKSSSVEKLKLPSLSYEMIYYNSLDYFMGSGGGEVFSYIVDLKRKEVYYAHLIIEGKQISLFLSENIENDEVKDFFLNIFRKDYPVFSIVDKDIRLDN